MKPNKKFLQDLLDACSPSGQEVNGTKVWDEAVGSLSGVRKYYSDKMGNSGWAIGEGPTKVLLSGHIDEICSGVVYISPEGYLRLSGMAGLDKKTLPGSSVIVLTDTGEKVHGVVESLAIHLQYSEKKLDSSPTYEDLVVDIGCESKEEVEALGVHVGCLVVPERNNLLDFGKSKLHGNSLDDKAGVFCVYEVLRGLSELNPDSEVFKKLTIIGLAAVGEESGCRGVMVAARNLDVDISIDLDVTHAIDGDLVPKEKYGDTTLGSGVVIEYGQDKSRRLANLMIDAAEKNGISYQRSLSRCGGTNTDNIQLFSRDCETMLLSLPLTSMHTPAETMNWKDIESAIKLLIETVKVLE